MKSLVLLLALIWGFVLAPLLQYVPLGRFLAARRTWITVVIGVGVDLALLALVLAPDTWLLIAAVVGLSSIGIIRRSLVKEYEDHNALLNRKGGERDQ